MTTQAHQEVQPKTPTRGPQPGTGQAPPLIEDHALIGDLNTAALVARDGTIDFLCLPDFDSDACFASLLGTRENGHWQLAPKGQVRTTRRRYRPNTLILETEFDTDEGTVRVVDFMPIRGTGAPYLVRLVEGLAGQVEMRSEIVPRFANGYTIPIIRPSDGATAAVAGPDSLSLRVSGERTCDFAQDFGVSAGDAISFMLSWSRPYAPIPEPIDADVALDDTHRYWEDWTGKLKLPKLYADVVRRSLITLKACTYAPSGAIVAAPTFGLPEALGGERNWDYRFCWLRDASLTLRAFIAAGLTDEAEAFNHWLADAVGGAPSQLQIMYGIRGERRLTETELDWLAGYGGARPVRIGNAAYDQFQLDIFGEFAVALYDGARFSGSFDPRIARALKRVATEVARVWTQQDHGVWESRGPNRSYTSSKVSAWAAINAWICAIAEQKLEEDKAPWVALRKEIFDEVCSQGFDAKRNTFTQYYGSSGLDGSLLAIPLFGFLPATDPRVVGTVEAIERELMPEGLVLRYDTSKTVDGLAGEEGVFLPCSFWLANAYHLMGRKEDARRLFEKLVGLCNDLGLLSEEYLPSEQRQVGNFPQAFSHLALVQSAYVLSDQAQLLPQVA
jgi:GH15 family glucan-1,4-alpha-glucosidase